MQILWADGGSAVVLSLQVDAIMVRSSRSSPPGSRLLGLWQSHAAPAALALRMKVHSSKLEPEGTFVLVGRLLDATKELRASITDGLKP
jgi:hypothetical protein